MLRLGIIVRSNRMEWPSPLSLLRIIGSLLRIAASAVNRLESIASAAAPLEQMQPTAIRERLYDILAHFRSGGAVTVLEWLQVLYSTRDGDIDRPGAALAEALERCRGIGARA